MNKLGSLLSKKKRYINTARLYCFRPTTTDFQRNFILIHSCKVWGKLWQRTSWRDVSCPND